MSDRLYGNAIWTNHALHRLTQRGLSQRLAWTAFQYPDSSTQIESDGTMEYKKRTGTSTITIIAKQNSSKEWIIISCWIDPPLPGSIDAKKKIRYQKYRQSGFWGKLWFQFLKHFLGQDF